MEPSFAQLIVRSLTRTVGGRVIHSDISFSVSSGETIFIVGPSGVGKSLLLRTLAYLDPFDSGSITLANKSPEQWGVPKWRALVTYVHQSRVQLKGTPAELYFTLQRFKSQRGRQRGDLPALVHQLGLEQSVLNQPWVELSGGQAQRLQLAIAIALKPLVLLLDEPTSALDAESARRVERVLSSCGAALVWVSHDPLQPARVGGRVLNLPLGNETSAVTSPHAVSPQLSPPSSLGSLPSPDSGIFTFKQQEQEPQQQQQQSKGHRMALPAFHPNNNQQQLVRVFGDLYSAIGWHPQHRALLELLQNATAGASSSGLPDPASLAAALLEVASGSSYQWANGGMLPGPAPGPAPSGGGGGGGGGGSGDDGGPVNISWLGLALGALVIAVNGLISMLLRLGLHGKLAVATVRCFAQLSVLGYILVPIFLANRWWLTLAYTLFMLVVAAVEAVSRPTQTYNGMLLQVLFSLGLASSTIISYGLVAVVQVSPWYDPQYLIPMLGMLLGNACSGVAVGLSTILDELSSGRDKVEMLLAMGATRMEATREVVQRAARMALTPLLNTMNVVGIVSIPGMMTGQILGGSDPATAARYQIIIMFLIGAATGLSSVASIFMAVVSLLDDRHRLRSERLVPRASSTKGAVAWLGAQIKQGWIATHTRAGQLATRIRLAFGRTSGRSRRPGSAGSGSGVAAASNAGYQPLPGEEGQGGQGGTEDAARAYRAIPSRLREVLVAYSVESSPRGFPAGDSPPPGADSAAAGLDQTVLEGRASKAPGAGVGAGSAT